jgi:hypothetical protein
VTVLRRRKIAAITAVICVGVVACLPMYMTAAANVVALSSSTSLLVASAPAATDSIRRS